MNPSQLELDRNITTLRINSSELSKMSNQELIVLLKQTIENIQGIAYYWATLSAEKKGILQQSKGNKLLVNENLYQEVLYQRHML